MSIFRTILDEDHKILQLKVPQSLHDRLKVVQEAAQAQKLQLPIQPLLLDALERIIEKAEQELKTGVPADGRKLRRGQTRKLSDQPPAAATD